MNLSTIKAPKGSRENKKRVGRGMGSGMGKTSTRGHKGQRSRSGSRMMRGFEGGQMPLHRRVPKRGFNNIFRQEYQIVNLETLALLGEKEVTPEVLYASGAIRKANVPVKILGDGELKSAMTVRAHKFSKSAQEKITAAGGTIEVIGAIPEQVKPVRQPRPGAIAKAAEAKAAAEAETKTEPKSETKSEAKAETKGEAKADKPAKQPKKKQ
jgi:large subunit ribosomal protein L15